MSYRDVDDVAAEFGVTRNWLLRQCGKRLLPHHRIGRQVKFSPDDVTAIAKATEVRPATVDEYAPTARSQAARRSA